MDDSGVAVLFQDEQILVPSYEPVGLCRRGQREEIVVVGVTTDGNDCGWGEQLRTPQEISDLLFIPQINKLYESWAAGDVLEFFDGSGRSDKGDPSRLDGVGDLMPPTFDEGADQDRGVEDRSDSGFSLRTSRTASSMRLSSIGGAARTRASIRSQMRRQRWAQVILSMASATRSCSSGGNALT